MKNMDLIKDEEDIFHDYEDEVVCPWCGYIFSDSFEFPNSCEEVCPKCENSLEIERIVNVTYSTTRIDEESDACTL